MAEPTPPPAAPPAPPPAPPPNLLDLDEGDAATGLNQLASSTQPFDNSFSTAPADAFASMPTPFSAGTPFEPTFAADPFSSSNGFAPSNGFPPAQANDATLQEVFPPAPFVETAPAFSTAFPASFPGTSDPFGNASSSPTAPPAPFGALPFAPMATAVSAGGEQRSAAELKQALAEAVASEDYAVAAELKAAIKALTERAAATKASERAAATRVAELQARLGQLECAKAEAVAEEEYARAAELQGSLKALKAELQAAQAAQAAHTASEHAASSAAKSPTTRAHGHGLQASASSASGSEAPAAASGLMSLVNQSKVVNLGDLTAPKETAKSAASPTSKAVRHPPNPGRPPPAHPTSKAVRHPPNPGRPPPSHPTRH